MAQNEFNFTSKSIECTFHLDEEGYDIGTFHLSFLPNVNETIDFLFIANYLDSQTQSVLNKTTLEDEAEYIVKARKFHLTKEGLSVLIVLKSKRK